MQRDSKGRFVTTARNDLQNVRHVTPAALLTPSGWTRLVKSPLTEQQLRAKRRSRTKSAAQRASRRANR